MQSAPSKPSRRRTAQRHRQQVEVSVAEIPADEQKAHTPEPTGPAAIRPATQGSTHPKAIDARWDAASGHLGDGTSTGYDYFTPWAAATQSGLLTGFDIQNAAILASRDSANATIEVCLKWFGQAAASLVQIQDAAADLVTLGFEMAEGMWTAPGTAR